MFIPSKKKKEEQEKEEEKEDEEEEEEEQKHLTQDRRPFSLPRAGIKTQVAAPLQDVGLGAFLGPKFWAGAEAPRLVTWAQSKTGKVTRTKGSASLQKREQMESPTLSTKQQKAAAKGTVWSNTQANDLPGLKSHRSHVYHVILESGVHVELQCPPFLSFLSRQRLAM